MELLDNSLNKVKSVIVVIAFQQLTLHLGSVIPLRFLLPKAGMFYALILTPLNQCLPTLLLAKVFYNSLLMLRVTSLTYLTEAFRLDKRQVEVQSTNALKSNEFQQLKKRPE